MSYMLNQRILLTGRAGFLRSALVKKAETEFGFVTRTPFRAGLTKTFQSYNEMAVPGTP
jgi:hypothetical protein